MKIVIALLSGLILVGCSNGEPTGDIVEYSVPMSGPDPDIVEFTPYNNKNLFCLSKKGNKGSINCFPKGDKNEIQ